MKQLKVGDKIRIKVPTLSGWKGKATVVAFYPNKHGGIVEFLIDGDKLDEYGRSNWFVCRHEIVVMRVRPNVEFSGAQRSGASAGTQG